MFLPMFMEEKCGFKTVTFASNLRPGGVRDWRAYFQPQTDVSRYIKITNCKSLTQCILQRLR